MDIISSLPVEIVERIFMYLEPKDLARCCAVNKNWYVLASSDRCWRRLCADLDFDGYESTHLGSCQSTGLPHRWKNLFSNYATIIQNWGRNKFKVCSMERIDDKLVVCSTVYNTVLVIGYMNNGVDVYTIKESEVKFTQQFEEMLDHTDVMMNAVVANSKVIAAKFGTVVLIYSSVGRNWKFSHLLYTKGGEPKLMYSGNKRTIKHAVDVGVLLLSTFGSKNLMGLAGDVLFLYMKDVCRIIIWDYVKTVCTVTIEVHPRGCSIVHFEERLYLGNCDRILVYNKNSRVELSLDIEYDIKHLFCNKNIILAQMEDDRLCAWERNTGQLLFTKTMSLPHDCILHPRRDVVFYLLYSRRPPPEVNKREIKAYDLRTGTVCWKTPVQKSHFNVIGHAFQIVAGRYLIFYTPSFGESIETWSVYDTLNGRYMYTMEKDSDVLLCSDRLLMRKDCSNSIIVQLYT